MHILFDIVHQKDANIDMIFFKKIITKEKRKTTPQTL